MGGRGWRRPGRRAAGAFAAALVLAAAPLACVRSTPLAEAQYATAIVGTWQSATGDVNESITFRADGGFDAELRESGFISNTLSQGVTGKLRGSWAITGAKLALTITRAENVEAPAATTSTIDAFSQDAITLRSEGGETSSFRRAL